MGIGTSTVGSRKSGLGVIGGCSIVQGVIRSPASSRIAGLTQPGGNCPEHLGLGVVMNKHFFKDGYFKNRANRCRHVPGDQEPSLSPRVEAEVGSAPGKYFLPVLWLWPHSTGRALGTDASQFRRKDVK